MVHRPAERGVSTRLASRSTSPAFDWADPGTWPAVLAGVRAAYLVNSPDLVAPGAVERVRALAAQAGAGGVRRLVLLSGRGESAARAAERAVLAQQGVPEPDARVFAEIFDTVLDGRGAYLADGVQSALGRAPRDFGAYARAAAATGVWDQR